MLEKEQELTRPSDLSSFKRSPGKGEVLRSSMLDTLDLHFEREVQSIAVHGHDGMGKSTLLSQFLQRHKESSIGLFIDPVNWQSYIEDAVVIDLYRQIHFFINGVDPEDIETITKRDLAKKIHVLSIFLQKQRKIAYFIVDGLSDIPSRDSYVAESIIEILPFSQNNIKILVSLEKPEDVKRFRIKNIHPIEMVLFGSDDAEQMLPELPKEDLHHLLDVFRGVPENLNIIKRLLESGMSSEEILQNYSASSDSRNLYEAEWARIETTNEEYQNILALSAFSIGSVTKDLVCKRLSIEEDTLESFIDSLGFLRLNNEYLEFSSKGMKLFCREKLKHLEEVSLHAILDYYSTSTDKHASLPEINLYNDRLGNYSEIVGQLSSENIKLLFDRSRSLNEAIKQIKIGRNAANKLSNTHDVLRFSHTQSLLSNLRTPAHLDSELNCYLAEDDNESAMALIYDAETIEERLQLLASIASYQKKKNDRVDDEISKKVHDDFELINPEHLGIERTTDLASELFSAFPEMSLALINKLDSLDRSGGNKADYALFRLSMNALSKDDDTLENLADQVDILEDKKKEAVGILGLFKRGTPARKIIKKVESFSDPGDAIFILRHWVRSFPNDEDVYEIINKLMSLIVTTTAFHANAAVYADVSTAVRYLPKDQGLAITKRIKRDLPDLRRIGPSIDYVRLQCNLYLFEEQNQHYSDRNSEIYSYIKTEIDDYSTKLSAFTLLHQFSRKSPGLAGLCDFDKEKEETFSALIKDTADHLSLVRDALLRETSNSFERSFNWASRLNTRSRRDQARCLVIKEACKKDVDISLDRICSEIRNIKNTKQKNEAATCTFKHFSDSTNISKADYKRLVKVRNKIKDSFVVCELNSHLLKIASKSSLDYSDQRAHAERELDAAFEKIEGNWWKINVAYKIHDILSGNDSEIASKYRDTAISIRKEDLSHNESIVNAQFYSVDLIVRTFYILCNYDLEDDQSFKHLLSSIKTLPSRIFRIQVAARLCSGLSLADKVAHRNEVIEDILLKEYEALGDEFSREFLAASTWALPILFKYSRSIFDRKINVLDHDSSIKDGVLWTTVGLLTNDVLLGDPFDPVKNHKIRISAGDLEEYIDIVGRIKNDFRLYEGVKKLVNVIVKDNDNRYSRTQKNVVRQFLSDIIETGFNSTDNICHNGYRLCCEALSLKLERYKHEEKWRDLIERAKQVPVKSDIVYIVGQIIESIPSSKSKFRKELLEWAVALTETLPSGYERICRYEYLAEIGSDVDKQVVKKFVEKAILLSTNEDSGAFEEKRLNLIDSLYSMDKGFASSLSAMVDDDPARKKVIEENIKRKNQERQENEEFDISDDQIGSDNFSSKYPDIMWGLLGKLNANNHVPNKRSDYQKFANNISQYPFEKAYPMLSYFIHAKEFHSNNKKQAQENVRPLFDLLINGADLFRRLCRLEEQSSIDIEQAKDCVVFSQGEETDVTRFLSNWIIQYCDGTLSIVDPYFCLEDFEFVGEVIKKDPDLKITILTSLSNMSSFRDDSDIDVSDAISDFWNDNVSSDSMPDIDVVFCGVRSLRDDMPIHDRWWLTERHGLQFGGSINGIGGKRVSSISRMNTEEVVLVESRIGGFLEGDQRYFDGERVKYQIVRT